MHSMRLAMRNVKHTISGSLLQQVWLVTCISDMPDQQIFDMHEVHEHSPTPVDSCHQTVWQRMAGALHCDSSNRAGPECISCSQVPLQSPLPAMFRVSCA